MLKGQVGEQMSVRLGLWVEKPLPTSWKPLELSPDLEPPRKGVFFGTRGHHRRQDHSEILDYKNIQNFQNSKQSSSDREQKSCSRLQAIC